MARTEELGADLMVAEWKIDYDVDISSLSTPFDFVRSQQPH